MNFTKIITMLLLVLFTLLTVTRTTTAVSGVANSDGSYSTDMQSQLGQPAAAGDTVRYLIPYMRSAVFASAGGGRVTTILNATNGGPTACNVTFEFYFAFNSDMIPECTINVALSPLLESGSDTSNVCSRPILGDRWTLCTASCNPSLNFVQGKAMVRVPENCAGAVVLDARMVHSDVNDDVRTINQLPVVRLRD